MSYLVHVVGGPLDGRDESRPDYGCDSPHEIAFEVNAAIKPPMVHVYRSDARRWPYFYQGVRERQPNEVVRGLHL